MYGRTAEQDIALEGRRALNRRYYGLGRWGHQPAPVRNGGWLVTRTIPKSVTWARGTGRLARKVHAVRYVLRADGHGRSMFLTVWWCGGQAHTAPQRESHPGVVCASCAARLSGRHEIVLADCPTRLTREAGNDSAQIRATPRQRRDRSQRNRCRR